MRTFESLDERELLALAISQEEEDERIYGDFAEALRKEYPSTADVFASMREEESGHRRRLIEQFRAKFGEHIPLIRRDYVKGFLKRKPVWLIRPLGIQTVRHQAEIMEAETRQFYFKAASRVGDASSKQLLLDLANEELKHVHEAEKMTEENVKSGAAEEENRVARRMFVLQVVQPGLAGLMDGSVSTLAPLFAAAFATGKSHDAFLVGLAASIGAGISMGFAEALSDDGALTGRGHPWIRGVVCGAMTTAGGIGHTLPFLIGNFKLATGIAVGVVVLELFTIAWIRHRYMDSPWVSATIQIIVGGALVFLRRGR
jgi:rubrerythrin